MTSILSGSFLLSTKEKYTHITYNLEIVTIDKVYQLKCKLNAWFCSQMNQILTSEIPLRLLENSPFTKEAEATLFIICWVVLVIGEYAISKSDRLNESNRPRSMAGREEKSLTS